MIEYTTFPGEFIKQCPCSPETVECGYYNLNLHTGCPFDCTYCILQTYLESRSPVYFTNLDKMERELETVCREVKDLRIGTGELSDSLAFDNDTKYSSKLLEIFSHFPKAVFEFKTKSNVVSNLLKFPAVPGNIVVAWSMNPQTIVDVEEPRTSSIKQRLEALREIQNRGYKIAIHFDPLLIYGNWQHLYTELIKQIGEVINPDKLAWWSIGALRFPASLKKYIFRHSDSRLFEGELIKGFDNKYRYFRPLRRELFSFVIKKIKEIVSTDAPVYLCMEDKEMWEDILPSIRPDKESVNSYLYQSVLNK